MDNQAHLSSRMTNAGKRKSKRPLRNRQVKSGFPWEFIPTRRYAGVQEPRWRQQQPHRTIGQTTRGLLPRAWWV